MADNTKKKSEKNDIPIRAPYNFVPFSNKVLCRYNRTDDLPSHDKLDKDLHSGEIHLTIEGENAAVYLGRKRSFFPHTGWNLCDSWFITARTGAGEYADSGVWAGSSGRRFAGLPDFVPGGCNFQTQQQRQAERLL